MTSIVLARDGYNLLEIQLVDLDLALVTGGVRVISMAASMASVDS